jgi:hypothetical protein
MEYGKVKSRTVGGLIPRGIENKITITHPDNERVTYEIAVSFNVQTSKTVKRDDETDTLDMKDGSHVGVWKAYKKTPQYKDMLKAIDRLFEDGIERADRMTWND